MKDSAMTKEDRLPEVSWSAFMAVVNGYSASTGKPELVRERLQSALGATKPAQGDLVRVSRVLQRFVHDWNSSVHVADFNDEARRVLMGVLKEVPDLQGKDNLLAAEFESIKSDVNRHVGKPIEGVGL